MAGPTKDRIDLAGAGLMLVLTATWGLNQVAIKIANSGISPFFQCGLRSLGALACIIIWCRVRRIPLLVRDGTLLPGLAIGVLFAVEFALIYEGLEHTDVARSVIYLYTAPFWIALGGHLLLPGERMRRAQVLGLAAAFIGLVLAVSDGLSLPNRGALLGDAMLLGAAMLWGATTMLARATRLAGITPERVLAYQMAVSGVLLAVVAPLLGERLVFDPRPAVVGALAYQIVIVAFATYLAWFALIRVYPVTRLAVFTFLTPLIGMLAGWSILGDRVSPLMAAALALVAVGIALVNRPEPRRAQLHRSPSIQNRS